MSQKLHHLNGVSRMQSMLDGTYLGESPSAVIADLIHFAEVSGDDFDSILRKGRSIASRERIAIMTKFGEDAYAPLPQERRHARRH